MSCVALLADRTAEMGFSGQLSSSASVLGITRSCRPWMCRGLLGVPKAQGLALSPATSLGKPATMPRKQTSHLEVSGCYDQPQLSSECPEAPPKARILLPTQVWHQKVLSTPQAPDTHPGLACIPRCFQGSLPRQAVCPLLPTHLPRPSLSGSTRTLTAHGFPL